MSNITYGASLVITIHHEVKGKPEGRTETLRFPVHSFEVYGGVKRIIDPASTDEIRIGSEFEQARVYKNIIFYIQPGKDAPTAELINLSKSDKKNFTMSFGIRVRDEEKTLRIVSLESRAVNFAETPIPVGGTPPLLKAKLSMDSPELWHGLRDEKQGFVVQKRM